MKTHIIDFRWVRPLWTHDGSAWAPMPLRLCAQVYPAGQGGGRVVDCCRCKAMEHSGSLHVITMADLAFGNVLPGVTEEQREEAARLFADNLRQEIPDAKIVCIIPDAASDFDLVAMRSQLMARFPSVDFLPASIGAVFDWEARPGRKVKDNELLIVADATPEGIQLTPVRAAYDKDVKRIVWERHPGKLVETDALRNMLRENIKRSRYPAEFAAFPGWNGLAYESGRLTLLCGGRWYELQEKSAGQFSGLPVDWKKLQPEITALAKGLGKPCAAVLCATDFFRCTERDDPRICSCSPCIGGFTWAARQRQDPETVQWYDYLPELSMEVMRNGRFELFPLVSKENRRIEPRRGKAVALSIPNRFTLPAGAKICSFPLFRGNGGTALRFTAEVHSRAFPLQEKAECHLKLSYTYGAPKPYQLTFEGSFGTAYTTWRPVPEPDPDMPGAVPSIRRVPFSAKILCDFRPWPEADDRIDLFQAAIGALQKRASEPTICEFKQVRIDKDGQLSIRVKEGNHIIACNAEFFFEPLPPNIRPGDRVYVQHVISNDRLRWRGGVTFSAPLSPHRMQPALDDLLPALLPVVVIKRTLWKGFGPGVLVDCQGRRVFVPEYSYASFLQLDCGTQLYCAILSEHISQSVELGAFLSSTLPEMPLKRGCPQKTYVWKRKSSNIYFYPWEFSKLPWILGKIYQHRYRGMGLPAAAFLDKFKKQVDAILSETHNLEIGDPECMDSIAAWLCIMGAEAPRPVMQIVARRMEPSIESGNSLPYDKYLHMLIGDMETKFQRGLFESVCRALGADNIYIRRSAQKVCANALRNRCLVNRLDCSTALAVFDAAHGALKACLNLGNPVEIIKNIIHACRLLKLMLEFRNSNNTRIVAELCINSKRCAAVLETVKKLSNMLMELGVPDMPRVHVVPAPSAYEGMYVPLYELHSLCSGSLSARVTIEDGFDEDDAEDLYDDD